MGRSKKPLRRDRRSCGAKCRGAVLLETILALTLLLVMVGLVSGAMHRSTSALERMKAQATAEDLAVSVLSEVQAGIRPRVSDGPEPFEEPWEDWTWRVDVTPVDGDPEVADRLEEVLVRVEQAELRVVHELRQWLWMQQAAEPVGF